MSPAHRIAISIMGVAAAAMLSGCATRSLYSQAGEQFSKGYEAAGNIVDAALATVVRDTRRLAVVYYLVNGDSDKNIDAANPADAFRRYACAGVGTYDNERLALGVIDIYGRMIAELSAEPSDNIVQLWASIRALRKPLQPLAYPAVEPAAFDNCIVSLDGSLVPPKGDPIVPLIRETPLVPFAAYESLGNLVDSAKAFVIAGLRIVDDAARAKAIREYVFANRETVARVIGSINEDGSHNEGEITDAALKTALDTRRRSALVSPWYQFTNMLTLDRTGAAHRIVAAGEAIHAALGEFDALRVQPDPRNVMKAVRGAQAELLRLANGELTAQEAWSIFQAYATTLQALEESLGTLTDTGKAI